MKILRLATKVLTYMKLVINKASRDFAHFVRVLMVVSGVFAIIGCTMDSAELGEYVRKEMQEELVKNDMFRSLQMKSVRLIKGEGVEYAGLGKGEIDGYPVKFDVKCKYDGKTVLWDASLVDDNMLTLAGVAAGKAVREKATDVYNKIKEAWPSVKVGIRQKYDVASKKAGEYCNAATKKVEEGIDSVKESIQGGAGKDSVTLQPPGPGNSQQ